MNDEAKNYELGFLIKEEASDEQIINLLKGYKAEILHEGKPRKVKLAYAIKKQIAAFFGYVHFSLNPESIKPLKEQLKLNDNILRSVIFSISKVQASKIDDTRMERQPELSGDKIRERKKPSDEAPRKKPEVVDNDLLEKKLEEILK